MKLQYARLLSGSKTRPVASTAETPIPQEFDFDSLVDCAQKVFALMGRAAGGVAIKACRLRMNRERRTAHLIGMGVHVLYRDVTLPMVTVSEAKDMVLRKVEETIKLGTIAPLATSGSASGVNDDVL